MDPATPITVGLFIAFFGAIAVALGFGYWLIQRFAATEKRFDEKLEKATEKLDRSLDEIKDELFGEVKKLTDRVNMMALAQSESRTWVSENFISKRTAELISGTTSKSIEHLQSSMESRMMRMESKIDSLQSRPR